MLKKRIRAKFLQRKLFPPFTNDLAEEADDYWRQMEQNLLINAVKAVGGPDKADRAFMLVNFKPGQETFDLYYQVDGKLISWQELDPPLVEKIRLQLLPQAPAVAHAVNENYEAANVPVISYAMLQLETATMAWFGRKLTTATPEASLSFEELVAGWRGVIEEEIPTHPIDSDTAFPYFEVR